jgi:RNA polymerase sigma-70 factor (ECF subfamily)
MPHDTTRDLVQRWQQGDQRAAEELFQRYADRLIGLARARLSAKLSRRIDAEDVVQSAYRSFFVGSREGRYEPQRGGDLWHLLVGLTLHKLHRQIRRNRAAKRNFQREVSWNADARLEIPVTLLAAAPAPLEAITLADELERIMSRLEPLDRRMLELRLQGHSLSEIAEATRRSQRTVSRVLNEIKQHLDAEADHSTR